MKKKLKYIIAFVLAIAAFVIIMITNIKYGKYMQLTQLSRDVWYSGKGYSIKADRCEILDMEELKEYVTNNV